MGREELFEKIARDRENYYKDREAQRKKTVRRLFVPSFIPNDYWELVSTVVNEGMCRDVACTTCGCMALRTWAKMIGAEHLKKILFAVTPDEIKAQNDFIWHDILEIIIRDFGNQFLFGSVVLKYYGYVIARFDDAKKIYHLDPRETPERILKQIKRAEL